MPALPLLQQRSGWGMRAIDQEAAFGIRPETDICLVTSYGIAESWGLL